MNNLRFSPLILFFIVFFSGSALTTFSWYEMQQNSEKKLKKAFEVSSQKIYTNIHNYFQDYTTIMSGVKGFFEGSQYISNQEFRDYVQALNIDKQTSGVQGIGFAMYVPKGEKNLHLEKIHAQDSVSYHIFPEGQRDYYVPIVYMEPRDKANSQVIGFDIATVPIAFEAMSKARDLNHVTITPRLVLKQDSHKVDTFGFVMYLPVYKTNAPLNTLEERRSSIYGWVDVPFRMNDVMAHFVGEIDTDIGISIYDGLELTNEHVLYHSLDKNKRRKGTEHPLKTHEYFKVGGRTWSLIMTATSDFDKRILNRASIVLIILLGAIITLILSFLAWSLARSKELAQQSYSQLFQQAGEGIFVLSSDNKLVDANPAALDLVGYSKTQLRTYHLVDLLHDKEAQRIGPITQMIMNGEPYKGEWSYLRKGGDSFIADVSACKLDEQHFFTIIRDLTEKKEAEKKLRLSAKVFESSKEGIVITDADNIVVSVNDAHCAMTGFPKEELIGSTPNILSSGLQSQEFYNDMWQTLLNKDSWRGEVSNRRKNGEIYPQWLSISVVKDEHEKVINYIGIMRDISEQKETEEKIRFLSNFDQLTQLPNFELLKDRANLAIATAQRENHGLALLYIDLDRFKIVNDSLGIKVGDELLQNVSERIVQHVHRDDTLSRQGGDEFFLMLPNTDIDGAAYVAQKLLKIIAQPFLVNNEKITITSSIGVAMLATDGNTFEELVQAADAALFQSKRHGRNAFRFFTQKMHEHASETLKIENELRHAIDAGDLILHYQPQIDAISRKLIGLEALVRWNHPEKGMISPGLFIPIAEESNLIIDLGKWVLKTAINQQLVWQKSGLELVPVAVNLSVIQCRQPSLYDEVTAQLRESKLDPSMLELEITEGIAMESSEYIVDLLQRFHDLGIKLSIDDFGTGYSSLSYLKQFKVDKLKIDQSFIRDIASDKDDEAIVTAIIDMSKALGFKTIAEGVETQEQLEFLCAKQCDEIQGYYFSKPLPGDEITKILKQNKTYN
jgi:diguanylate cyclase (GGDEF)-like protein/PAS domain S-box-containing protein